MVGTCMHEKCSEQPMAQCPAGWAQLHSRGSRDRAQRIRSDVLFLSLLFLLNRATLIGHAPKAVLRDG
jgi:hypothetical protein